MTFVNDPGAIVTVSRKVIHGASDFPRIIDSPEIGGVHFGNIIRVATKFLGGKSGQCGFPTTTFAGEKEGLRSVRLLLKTAKSRHRIFIAHKSIKTVWSILLIQVHLVHRRSFGFFVGFQYLLLFLCPGHSFHKTG